jgi:hypothetical protein
MYAGMSKRGATSRLRRFIGYSEKIFNGSGRIRQQEGRRTPASLRQR